VDHRRLPDGDASTARNVKGTTTLGGESRSHKRSGGIARYCASVSQADVEVAETALRLWNQGDREGFLAMFHVDGRWSSAIKRQVEGGEGLYQGREQIGKFWDEWHAIWEELTITISDLRSPRDGCVFAFGALHGTGIGSGIGLERPFGWVFQVEEGLIREVRAYLSREEALEAAGLSE
jgi:ketosteroid isomerase-like protein